MISIVLLIFLTISDFSTQEVDITAGPPNYDKPWVEGWGYNKSDPTLWKQNHEHMLQMTRESSDKIKIIFFGDSKTAGWLLEAKDIWDEKYPKMGAFNYGIRGDSTRQIIYRIDHKELDGIHPKLMVFMIGGNNLKNNYNRGTDEEIIKAYHVIAQKLREKLPNTQVIIVGQLARADPVEDKRGINLNKLLKTGFPETNKWIHFLDVSEKFRDIETKSLNKQLYISDGIHLNRNGYKLLSESIEPLIEKYLNN